MGQVDAKKRRSLPRTFAAQVEAELARTSKRKELICALLEGIETGDAAAVTVINEEKHIQHNPQTHEGSEGPAVLSECLSKTSPGVKVVRVFVDVMAVEHWHNIQQRKGSKPSAHTMVDGPTEVTDLDCRLSRNCTILR